jgi:hypothetical protein
MNPYRTFHTILSLWALWALLGVLWAIWRFGGWDTLWPVLLIAGAIALIAIIFVGYGELLHWLDMKAQVYGMRQADERRKSHSGGGS